MTYVVTCKLTIDKKGVSEMGSVRKIDLSYKHKLSVVVGQE